MLQSETFPTAQSSVVTESSGLVVWKDSNGTPYKCFKIKVSSQALVICTPCCFSYNTRWKSPKQIRINEAYFP